MVKTKSQEVWRLIPLSVEVTVKWLVGGAVVPFLQTPLSIWNTVNNAKYAWPYQNKQSFKYARILKVSTRTFFPKLDFSKKEFFNFSFNNFLRVVIKVGESGITTTSRKASIQRTSTPKQMHLSFRVTTELRFAPN